MTQQVDPTERLQRGFVVPERLPSREAVGLAMSLESAGFDLAWLTEIVRDPFTRAAVVLDRTTTLRVGTAVAQWSRSPITAAMTAAELHELSGERFVFGVGTSTKSISEDLHNIAWDKPARQMADYLCVVRGAWAATREPFTLNSDYFPVKSFTQPYHQTAPKLMIAAVGEGMLRVAGRLADGVLFNPASTQSYCREVALPILSASAEKAGRDSNDIERHVTVRCAVDHDRDVARRWARLGICEYGRYPIHLEVYRANGFEAEARAIATAMGSGDIEAAIDAVSDPMVDAFSIAGTPQEARDKLHAWGGLVHGVSFSATSFGMDLDELRANCASVRDTFATSAAEESNR
jgi:alkanesulfonate monooxygenase SsuD/methylene tetrahydromethanopterin reductase-like flavin-dependent oxidoreductase (luciferase family)